MRVFVHMAMPAAMVCDRVCMCVFSVCIGTVCGGVHCTFWCDCMTECRQLIVFVSACVYGMTMCVWKATC